MLFHSRVLRELGERPNRMPTNSASPFCHFVHDIIEFLVLGFKELAEIVGMWPHHVPVIIPRFV